LPSAVHVSSVIKRGASGDWEICFCYFPDRFLRQTCVYVYMYIIFVVLVVVRILFCVVQKKRRSRDESRHELITKRAGWTKSVSYLCFPLISDER